MRPSLVSPATITLPCDSCGTDVPFLASRTTGTATLPGAVPSDHDGDAVHSADIAHAWRHGGWCVACGVNDGEGHADGCALDIVRVPSVGHDAVPDGVTFPVFGILPTAWNGWAVPVFATAEDLRHALSVVWGDDARVTVTGDAVTVVPLDPSTDGETFTRDDACGMWVADGGCWVA